CGASRDRQGGSRSPAPCSSRPGPTTGEATPPARGRSLASRRSPSAWLRERAPRPTPAPGRPRASLEVAPPESEEAEGQGDGDVQEGVGADEGQGPRGNGVAVGDLVLEIE